MKTKIILLLFSLSPGLLQAQWGNCGPMSYSTELCAGASTSITGTPIVGTAYYQWVVYNGVSGTYLSSYTTTSPNNTLYTSSSQAQAVAWDVSAFNSGGLKIGACGGTVIISSRAPSTPSNITWSGNLCIEQAKTYTCTVVGASSYLWEIGQIGYSQTTSSNQILISGYIFSQPGYYTLRVKANNACGSSGWREATIQVVSGCPPY